MTKMESVLAPTVTGDCSALDAARRLANRLPKRKGGFSDSEGNKKINTRRPIVVNGVAYQSMRKAAAAHRISCSAMAKWLANGKAAFA